jgi:DNA-binding beta-propeller fold protein YncE
MSRLEYFRRLWLKLKPYLFDPAHRRAAWDIWFNRDYRAYGELTNKDFSLANWNPSEKIRLYIRVDTAAKVWDYGVAIPVEDIQTIAAPYEEGMNVLAPDLTFGTSGSLPGELSNPHDIALAPDGSLYIADTMNQRIQQFSPTGELIRTWGSYGDVELNNAYEGTFNKPFGIGVAPDGTVYVADTWNHRIQHFTAEGEFLEMFGTFGQSGEPMKFWGPRDVAIDSQYRIFVSDTGNKRVVVFDRQGDFITEFGSFGLDLGYLDEPVGIAVKDNGTVFVADTWNQRVQVFEELGEGFFQAVREWPIAGWYGQSLENKPYIAVGPQSVSCVTDPESARVLCFDVEGNFLTGWESSIDQGILFGNLAGITFDTDCGLWVSDSTNDQIMHFSPDVCQD